MSDTVLAGGAVAAVVAALVVFLLTHHSSKSPATVQPVPHAATATQQARNLEAWLKEYSG